MLRSCPWGRSNIGSRGWRLKQDLTRLAQERESEIRFSNMGFGGVLTVLEHLGDGVADRVHGVEFDRAAALSFK